MCDACKPGGFMTKILIVEDEPIIRRGIKMWLTKSDFEVDEAADGREAIEKVELYNYDLIVLDVMLPISDGFAVLQHLRQVLKKKTPVIMLTAKAQEDDKILGLNLGADDYMVKPFSNRELEARINANLRRSAIDDEDTITVELGFEIDERQHILRNGDLQVECSRKELDLLLMLIQRSPLYVSKKELLETIWGYLGTEETRTLDIHISKLRKKLSLIDIENVIETKRGVGFGFMTDKE